MKLSKFILITCTALSLFLGTMRATAFDIIPCEEFPECPSTPSETHYGDYPLGVYFTVREGNVIDVSGTPCPDKIGAYASVAATSPSEGDPMFAVAWFTQVCCTESESAGNKLLVSRFDKEGNCISPGAIVISDIYDNSNCGSTRTTSHRWPSLALSREGDAYLTWLGDIICTSALHGPPSRVTYGPFNILESTPVPGSNWPARVVPPGTATNEYATSTGIGVIEASPVEKERGHSTLLTAGHRMV